MADGAWFDDWLHGCPACGESGTVAAIVGLPGQPITEELECPFCGHAQTETQPNPNGRTIAEVFQYSAPAGD